MKIFNFSIFFVKICFKNTVKCYYQWPPATTLYDGAYAYTEISKEGAKFTYIQASNDEEIYTYTIPPRIK